MHHRVQYSFAVLLFAFEGYVSTESSANDLCKWCLCIKDESTWMTETSEWEDTAKSNVSSQHALLVNCSGVNSSPFAGVYTWPDVPQRLSREYQANEPKVTDVPATRADFSSCGLHGGLRRLPTKETRRLKELSLSHNSLSWIESDSFARIPGLKFLDLSYNKFVNLPSDSFPLASDLSVASKLEVILISHNDLPNVPWEALLRLPKLKKLDLSSNLVNSIETGFGGDESDLIFESIKVLNFRHNRLTDLSIRIPKKFPGLVELDLSWNDIKIVPEAFLQATDTHFKNLSVLNLDGNPIKSLGSNSFVGSPSLRTLSVSATSTLSEISSLAFDGLRELKVLRLRKNVLLSRLPKEGFLRLDGETSGKWAIEEVDLSYNSLEYVSEDFLPWKKIRKVNIQGNPWNCNCSLQWMLDSFMPYVYEVDSNLLLELRCSKPKWLQGRRFVHWLGRSSGVYCGNLMEKLRMRLTPTEVKDVDLVAMGMNTGMITVLIVIGVIVVGLTVTAVALQRRAVRRERDLRTQNYLCRNPRY